MTSDICSICGYGKPRQWGGVQCVADTMPSPSSRARRCQKGYVSALAAGSPCAGEKLICSVGSAGSFGSGAEGVEHDCSCSINRPNRLRSRD